MAENMRNCNMLDVVHVSEMNLIGEILEIHEDKAPFRFMKKPQVWVRGNR